MRDYRLELRVKNGLLWTAMKDFGHETMASLSRATGVPQTELCKFMNLKEAPLTQTGELRKHVCTLCEYFGMSWQDLFPPEVHYVPVRRNKYELFTNAMELEAARGNLLGVAESAITAEDPAENFDALEMEGVLADTIAHLPARCREVLEMRFGLNGTEPRTLREIGEFWDVSFERVRQIEAKALRLLRHGGKETPLRTFAPTG